MPMKDGKSHEVISSNVKELVREGHDPKLAVAMALSHSRKFAEGGVAEDEGLVPTSESVDEPRVEVPAPVSSSLSEAAKRAIEEKKKKRQHV